MRQPMRRLTSRLSTVAVLSVLFLGLVGVTAAQAAAPTITSFTPTSGGVGTVVTITGTNFNNPAVNDVEFNNLNAASFNVASNTQITATVPTGATDGPIEVTNADGTATSSAIFDVIPAPTITSFTPTSGQVGTSVVITGTNFTGATAVKFNNVSATTFTVDSATQITATVPTGATTGLISVTTPGGTATSTTNFTVTVVHARSVTLNLRGHLTARGAVAAADGFAACEDGATVKVQKRGRGGGWRTVATTTTSAGGSYQRSIPDRPGSYRAVVVRSATATDICNKDKSPRRRHRH